MSTLRKYRKKPDSFVIAVQLDLETEGFSYQKWGAVQTCKPGDWLVNNAGDTYTIAADSFAETYVWISPGIYYKQAEVYAEVVGQDGKILTKEGETSYLSGDYLVFNQPDRKDGYAVSRDKFEKMYELDE